MTVLILSFFSPSNAGLKQHLLLGSSVKKLHACKAKSSAWGTLDAQEVLTETSMDMSLPLTL